MASTMEQHFSDFFFSLHTAVMFRRERGDDLYYMNYDRLFGMYIRKDRKKKNQIGVRI